MTNLQEGKKGKERIKKEGRKEERKGRRDRGRKSLPCKIMQSEKIEILSSKLIVSHSKFQK